jgi:hypothetical protein
MKKISLLSFALISIIFFSSSFKKNTLGDYHHPTRSGGAAAVGGAGRTGAPFNTSTCSGNGGCHGGGSFAPTFNVGLLDNTNTVVTNYTAGANYTLRISIIATVGTPQYGFQTTSVKSADNTNLNTWGVSLPAGVANVLLASSNRNYVEHNTLLSSGIIDIPWTAPAANYGAVKFYTAGNAIDGTGGTGNDSPTAGNVLTIGESILPVSLISFTAKQAANGINLFWETAQEINNNFFDVQHSTNGSDFTSIGKVTGNGTTSIAQKYNFYDKYSRVGINFYRLAQTDFDGKVNYSPLAKIQNKIDFALVTVSPNPVVNKITLKSNFALLGEKYSIINNQGATVLSGIFINNEIDIQKLAKGNYFIRIEQKVGELITAQFVK